MTEDAAVAELLADIERQELAKRTINGLDRAGADLDNLTDQEREEKWARARNGLCPSAVIAYSGGRASFVTCDLLSGHLIPHSHS